MTLIPPTLNYVAQDYVNATNGKPTGLTFTRATTATYVNAAGLIASASSGALRHDYDPVTGEYKGWLIEDARTNEALRSRDLSNATWTKTNATAALSQTGADGVASSASLLTATSANGTCTQAITSGSAARRLSAYLKRSVGTGLIYMTLDGGSTWTDITASMTGSGPNGFARVGISQTLANPTIGFKIATSGDAIVVDYVQEEVGAFDTSAIPTTTASVTRNADVLSIATSSITAGGGAGFNANEGTFYVNHDVLADTGYGAALFANGGGNIDVQMAHNSGSLLQVTNTLVQAQFTGSAYVVGTYKKAALAWKVNDFAGVWDGGTVQTDTSGTVPTLTTVYVGSTNSGQQLNGHIRHMAYFPRRLSNADLQTITT